MLINKSAPIKASTCPAYRTPSHQARWLFLTTDSINKLTIMAPAQKVSKSGKKATKQTFKSSKLQEVSEREQVSESDVDFSSDEENIEIKGVDDEPVQNTTNHTVNLSKTQEKATKSSQASNRGLLYVGSLPKTFQQYELKKYFSQFGEVTRVRLSKIKKTGKSRGYGFVEFKDLNSAEVAAETMDNYLLAGSNIKVQLMKNHADNIFSSKMKSSFGEFDWRQKEYNEYNAPKPAETWKELEVEFEERKKATMDELKKAGFNYSLEI